MWTFDPRDPRLGLPRGRVQELHVLHARAGVTLAHLRNIKASRGDAPHERLVLVHLTKGSLDGDLTDPIHLAHLTVLRFAARVAGGDAPEILCLDQSPLFRQAMIAAAVGEAALATARVHRLEGGSVRLYTYQVPSGASQSFLLFRDGGPLPS